jgi:hypothetical protein
MWASDVTTNSSIRVDPDRNNIPISVSDDTDDPAVAVPFEDAGLYPPFATLPTTTTPSVAKTDNTDKHRHTHALLRQLITCPPDLAWTAEQRTDAWFRARACRVTASVAAAAMGMSDYSKPSEWLRGSLWHPSGGVPNRAMQYGTVHETTAERVYAHLMGVVVDPVGLWIPTWWSWLGASPDGIINHANNDPSKTATTHGLEIKCPYKLANRKIGEPFYPNVRLPPGWMGCVPREYFVQTQLQAFVLGVPFVDFFVCTPTGCQLTRIPMATDFILTVLLPRLTFAFTNLLVPALKAQAANLLKRGDIFPGVCYRAQNEPDVQRTRDAIQFGLDTLKQTDMCYTQMGAEVPSWKRNMCVRPTHGVNEEEADVNDDDDDEVVVVGTEPRTKLPTHGVNEEEADVDDDDDEVVVVGTEPHAKRQRRMDTDDGDYAPDGLPIASNE